MPAGAMLRDVVVVGGRDAPTNHAASDDDLQKRNA